MSIASARIGEPAYANAGSCAITLARRRYKDSSSIVVRLRYRVALLFSIAALFVPVSARAQVDLRGVSPSRSVSDSKAKLAQRVERVLAYYRRQGRASFDAERGMHGAFVRPAIAELWAGGDMRAINEALLSPLARPWANYGSTVNVIPGVCQREGDYDFVAQGLLRLAYLARQRPGALKQATYERIAWELLPERGARQVRSFQLGICGRHDETENHILMTETARYLTNQLLVALGRKEARFDNRANGFDPWLLKRMQRALSHHFDEYNARPYQGYTVGALENLHSYASSPAVSRAAGMTLDYLSAIFAVQSNGLRRFPPFRRQARYEDSQRVDDHDSETARFAMLAGNYHFYERYDYQVSYGSRFMFNAALSEYRPDDAVLDLVIDKSHNRYYQKLHHDNVEVYASSDSFLISAGGVFARHFQFGSDEQHGWARPTVLIPTRDIQVDPRAWLRIEGNSTRRRRNNTCVAPGFACGLNVRIPDHIPASCREQHGSFTFLDLTGPRCGVNQGFYAAVYRRPCASARCRAAADNYGFIEAREGGELSFRAFVDAVLAENAKVVSSDVRASYVTSDGRKIVFEPVSIDTERWPIISIDGVREERSFQRWPLAQGDVINARGDGLVTVDNRHMGVRIELDMRDALAPQKRVIRTGRKPAYEVAVSQPSPAAPAAL
jgi:hypothetical protein